MNGSHKRWCVLISGRGSNLGALLELRSEINIVCVMSSTAKAHGLLRAKRAGIPTWVMPKPIDWEAVHSELLRRGVTHIFLAGFMRIVPAAFLLKWPSRILNLHPSMLPTYPGLQSIERAHRDRADLGCTVHEVIPAVDEGPIVVQRLSLKASEACEYSLEQAEFKLHLDEQRIIKEAVRRWNP